MPLPFGQGDRPGKNKPRLLITAVAYSLFFDLPKPLRYLPGFHPLGMILQ